MSDKPYNIIKAMSGLGMVSFPKQAVYFIRWEHGGEFSHTEYWGPYCSWQIAATRLSYFLKSTIETKEDLKKARKTSDFWQNEGPFVDEHEVEILPDGRLILNDRVFTRLIDADNLEEYLEPRDPRDPGPGDGRFTKDQIKPLD